MLVHHLDIASLREVKHATTVNVSYSIFHAARGQYKLGFSKSDQQSQWIRTEVCLYCRQVTQELTLLLVGTIRRRTYSSARNFLAPSFPECSPQSAPDYTDTGSSAGAREAVRRWTHEGLFDSLARIRRDELLREYRERYNRQANTVIALVSIPSLL